MMRRQNMQHGRARRHPVSRVWPALAGVLLAYAVALPVVMSVFGGV